MIEIENAKILRFTREEIYRRKPEKVDPYIDWFSVQLLDEYPEWHIERVLHDGATDYVYVILTPEILIIESYIEPDDDGRLIVKERIL